MLVHWDLIKGELHVSELHTIMGLVINVNPYYNSRSETDLNKHWEISASLGPTLSAGNKQKYNSHDTLEPNLSIEDAFDKAMSLPSSPTVKNAEDSFDSFEDDVARKPRSASEKNKKDGFRDRQAASPSSSLALGRKTFFDGLKIRGRTKSGDNFMTEKAGDHTNSVNGSVSEEKINGLQTRPEVGPCGLLTAGSVSTVLIDYRAVREDEVSVTKGEVVTVIASNLTRGYLVHRAALSHVSPPAEGWIPSYCLHIGGHHTKKPSAWAFKIRKQSFSKLSKQESSASLGDRGFVEHLNNMSVTLGEKAVFSCRLETSATIGCQLVWKGPGGGILQSGGRVMAETSDNGGLTLATLSLEQCQLSDAGDYYCILANEDGSVSTQARLTVTSVPRAPGQPKVQDLRGNSAVVTWDRADTGKDRVFSLQMCRIATGHWQTVRDGLTEGLCIVDSLVQGETYSFRVLSHGQADLVASLVSEPSPPSLPLTVPLSDLSSTVAGVPATKEDNTDIRQLLDPAWRPDFELQYIELEEVGRGRCSVVRRCQEILTGREVAVKFVNRRKQNREQTRREYENLRRLSHPNIVSASGLFVTASSDAIVMDL